MAQVYSAPGVYEDVLDTETSDQLRYTLTIPEHYQPDRPVPLVLVLHYGWDKTQPLPSFYGKRILVDLFHPALSTLGAIMVSPDCPSIDWTNPESEAAILALLSYLKKYYNIDEGRILVTGYSLGGAGTWYLASRHPEVFSAAIPLAGSAHENIAGTITDVPFYIIHGRNDEVIPIELAEEAARQLRLKEARVEFVTIEGITHYETSGFIDPLKATLPWIRKMWKF